jgi:hypothetical protein
MVISKNFIISIVFCISLSINAETILWNHEKKSIKIEKGQKNQNPTELFASAYIYELAGNLRPIDKDQNTVELQIYRFAMRSLYYFVISKADKNFENKNINKQIQSFYSTSSRNQKHKEILEKPLLYYMEISKGNGDPLKAPSNVFDGLLKYSSIDELHSSYRSFLNKEL